MKVIFYFIADSDKKSLLNLFQNAWKLDCGLKLSNKKVAMIIVINWLAILRK